MFPKGHVTRKITLWLLDFAGFSCIRRLNRLLLARLGLLLPESKQLSLLLLESNSQRLY